MSKQLLNTISDKLQQVRGQNLLEKKRQKEQNEEQIQYLQAMISERKGRQNAEIAIAKEQLDKIIGLIQLTSRNATIRTNKESEQIVQMKEELTFKIQEAQNTHQDHVQQTIQRSERKALEISQDIDKKTKHQRDKIEGQLSNLSKKLVRLQKDFKDQCENRKTGGQRMKEQFEEGLQQLKEVVEQQQQRRVSWERKMQAMREQIAQKLSLQIDAQQQKRKRNNEAMLKLIEVACQKIQQRYAE